MQLAELVSNGNISVGYLGLLPLWREENIPHVALGVSRQEQGEEVGGPLQREEGSPRPGSVLADCAFAVESPSHIKLILLKGDVWDGQGSA